MSGPTVVGLDLSLTSTGLAIIDAADTVLLWTTGSNPAGTLSDRWDRLTTLRDRILLASVVDDEPALVVIEGPSHGQGRQGGQFDRAGLWWLVVDWLCEHGQAVAEVSPGSRAKYATGSGNAGKAAVVAEVARRYPAADLSGSGTKPEDKADALVLAAMGRRWLGHPIEDSLPKTHLAAMDGVHWPEVAP